MAGVKSGVISEMATLAHGHEVGVGAVGWVVVEVRCGEDDDAAGLRVSLSVGCSAFLARSFGPLEANTAADLIPVWRV